MQSILNIIVSAIVSLSIAFGVPALQTQEQNFGQTVPTVVALFESSLSQGVTTTATSMTLERGTDKAGTTLSGTYGFIIDEGSSNEEFVLCTAAGTALSGCTRGLSVVDGKTAVTALQKVHRRGATVKITDFPQLAILSRIVNGTEYFPNLLRYETNPNFSGASSASLATVGYIASVSYAGTVDASTTAKGIVEAATTAEINAGTDFGATGAYLFTAPNFLALSSYSSQLLSEQQELALSETSGGVYGTPSSTNKFLTQYTASSSSIFMPVVRVYTASTSWSKPAGLKYIVVELCGGGAAGTTAVSGAGGGYAKELIPASSLNSSELVVVASVSGTSYFKSFDTIRASGGSGITPGTGTGGDFNTTGQGGGGMDTAGTDDSTGAHGGSSRCGGGGQGGTGVGPGAGAAGVFGGGGGSSGYNNGVGPGGGAGSKGIIIIEEHYI